LRHRATAPTISSGPRRVKLTARFISRRARAGSRASCAGPASAAAVDARWRGSRASSDPELRAGRARAARIRGLFRARGARELQNRPKKAADARALLTLKGPPGRIRELAALLARHAEGCSTVTALLRNDAGLLEPFEGEDEGLLRVRRMFDHSVVQNEEASVALSTRSPNSFRPALHWSRRISERSRACCAREEISCCSTEWHRFPPEASLSQRRLLTSTQLEPSGRRGLSTGLLRVTTLAEAAR
jgi:hypothetical protein